MTTSMTETRLPLPRPATGPIECQPWCVYRDGHTETGCREDQRCYTADLRVDLSLHPAVEESLNVEGQGWALRPDHIEVNGEQQADQRWPRVTIRRETGESLEMWEFTTIEAQQLIEALQLVLGQIGGAR